MKTFRSKIFKAAHQVRKNTGKKFSICLIQAWKAYKLKQAMKVDKVKFAFETLSGSLRYAIGTLQTSYQSKGNKKQNFGIISYFDVEKEGFRSFRIENLIQVYNGII